MNRRDFLAKFSKSAAACGAATTAIAVGAHHRSRSAVEDGTALIKGRLQALEDRADQLNASQKRLLKIVAITFSVSTGIDIATLL
jgi:hypothetical protein